MFNRLLSFVFVALALLLSAQPAEAQFWEKVKDAAKRGAERAAERETAKRADRAVTEAFGLAEDAVVCAVTDETCIEEAQAEGNDVVVVDEDGDPLPASQQPSVQANQATAEGAAGGAVEGANANYDFEPGTRTLFAEDFSSDNVGDFPRRLEFKGGSAEIVEWQGARALRANAPTQFDVALPEVLPERFTLEFEFHTPDFVNSLRVYPVDNEGEAVGAQNVNVEPYGDRVGIEAWERDGISSMGNAREQITSRLTPIRVMADGAYVKVFAGTERMANIPNADLGRTATLRFDFNDVRDQPAYISNLRIAAGGKDLYDALESEGRVAVQDILFDTGEATIQPASAETLQEIATLLTEHPDLRLLVEGHTDDEGGFESNMTLSKARAEAVRAYLVENHGIDASRLRAMGLGQTQPAASNDSEAGRAENRRVELVKM